MGIIYEGIVSDKERNKIKESVIEKLSEEGTIKLRKITMYVLSVSDTDIGDMKTMIDNSLNGTETNILFFDEIEENEIFWNDSHPLNKNQADGYQYRSFMYMDKEDQAKAEINRLVNKIIEKRKKTYRCSTCKHLYKREKDNLCYKDVKGFEGESNFIRTGGYMRYNDHDKDGNYWVDYGYYDIKDIGNSKCVFYEKLKNG